MAKKTYVLIITGITLILTALLSSGCMPVSSSASASQELVQIAVSHVGVEIGVGSPIPVEVVASGEWPGLCTQIAEISQEVSEGQFHIGLMASPDTPGCPPDRVGLPFRIALPLNMVELPDGEYNVTVNGVSTTFEWNQGH